MPLSGSDKSCSSIEQPTVPTLLQQLMWRHTVLFNTAQELILLLLVGVLTTALVFSVDKSIEVIRIGRTSARLSWHDAGGFLPEYLVWTGSSLLLCTLSVACVHLIGPSAAGSGIPQMKCVLAGVQIFDYLSVRTLVAKATSLVFALSGGLSIGKEGPYVHMASCVAHQLCRLPCFRRVAQNEHLRRQVRVAPCRPTVPEAPPPRQPPDGTQLRPVSGLGGRSGDRCSPRRAPPVSRPPLARPSAGCSFRSR